MIRRVVSKDASLLEATDDLMTSDAAGVESLRTVVLQLRRDHRPHGLASHSGFKVRGSSVARASTDGADANILGGTLVRVFALLRTGAARTGRRPHGAVITAEVIVRGPRGDRREEAFLREVLAETVQTAGISQRRVLEYTAETTVERGAVDHPWSQAALKAIDREVPGASSLIIALATRDVHRYLHRAGLRDVIETGVRPAMSAGGEMIVVAHSLGTVVTYNLLRREGGEHGWRIPLLVTLGAPLAVRAIKRSLMPIRFPEVVSTWFNARDPRDLVALHPLDARRFAVQPTVENWDGVRNSTPNRHGISGYLGDPTVARRIYDALTA